MVYTKTSDMETGDTVLEINAFIMKTCKSLIIHKLKWCGTDFQTFRQIHQTFPCFTGDCFFKAIDTYTASWPFLPLLHEEKMLSYCRTLHGISIQLKILL